MTKTYALKRLLEHGDLTKGEIRTYTGWSGMSVTAALQRLLITGVIQHTRGEGGIRCYTLSNG